MAFDYLRQWLQTPARQRPDLNVVVLTRENCPLCDEAWEMLTHYQKRHGFKLEAQNVDASESLACEFGNCVPVVKINGKVRFRGKVNEVLLMRLLDA